MATRAEFGRSLSQPEDTDGGSGAPWKQRIYASIYRLRYGTVFFFKIMTCPAVMDLRALCRVEL